MKSQTSSTHGDPNRYCEFTTRRLNVAAWLHCEGLLEYVGCTFNARIAKVEFRFDDPRREGRTFEDQFDGGAAATSALKLFNSMHHMRRQLSDAQKFNGETTSHVQPESRR